MTGRKARENTQRPGVWAIHCLKATVVGGGRRPGCRQEYGGRMGAGPLPCGDLVTYGPLVSDQLMMTLNHLPFTITGRHSATLSASCTGECVSTLARSWERFMGRTENHYPWITWVVSVCQSVECFCSTSQ